MDSEEVDRFCTGNPLIKYWHLKVEVMLLHVLGLGSYLTPYQFPFAPGEVRNSFAD